VAHAGPKIVLGLPLGLGKACTIANALYERVARDPSLRLHIFTALTLEAPHGGSELERRFLGPIAERTMGGYPKLAYAEAQRRGAQPPNIEVNEFFFLAGRWLSVPSAQQSYVSANYTHACRYLIDRGVNVIAQLVAKKEAEDAPRYSLSCNTDLTLDFLAARRDGRANFLLVGEVNGGMPFMPGEGDLPADEFSHMLDDPSGGFPLFGPPNEPVGLREYAIGLHAARLIVDGGTLQLGIGQESDATVHALILRQAHNARFQNVLSVLSNGAPIAEDLSPLSTGLYGVSEMFVDGFLWLIESGILKREVDGALLHAAFFLGPHAFYRRLREMPAAKLDKIRMMAVSFTNEIGVDADKLAARTGARFINSTMITTLLGAAVSDGLEDGRVVSGVGGQYNFVAQAFALEGAKSILTLKATRGRGRAERSNIRWSYGHETIPRHLRDVFITEYGIADVRGKCDADVIASMLAVADSRFQPELLRAAKDARKIPAAYEIPAPFRENTPERIARALKPLADDGLLPSFPLGSDLDANEQKLAPLLATLQSASAGKLAALALKGLLRPPVSHEENALLLRMGLATPSGVADRVYRLLLRGAYAPFNTA
jgi:acyl-CoA hydrolase